MKQNPPRVLHFCTSVEYDLASQLQKIPKAAAKGLTDQVIITQVTDSISHSNPNHRARVPQ